MQTACSSSSRVNVGVRHRRSWLDGLGATRRCGGVGYHFGEILVESVEEREERFEVIGRICVDRVGHLTVHRVHAPCDDRPGIGYAYDSGFGIAG